MKAALLLCIWWLAGVSSIYAAQDRSFLPTQHRMKAYQGERVLILADSAFIVSMAQAQLLNEKLMALRHAQQTHAEVLRAHEALLDKVQDIEAMTARLLHRMQLDHQVVHGNLLELLAQLDQSIDYLKAINEELATNNVALQDQLATMDDTIKSLRKTNRKLAWRNTRDKVVIGVVAMGLGFLFGSM